MEWLKNNWKFTLIGAFALVVLWAFTPSCATRRGAAAAAAAQEAIATAQLHKERADVAEKAHRDEIEKAKVIEAERTVLQQEKAVLTQTVARLRKALPPRPVVGEGAGVPGAAVDDGGIPIPGSDGSLVQQLYDVVDAQAALIAKHVEDDAKTEILIASLKRAEEKAMAYGDEQKARADALDRALVQKDLQIKAMKSVGVKQRVRDVLITALVVAAVEELRNLKK